MVLVSLLPELLTLIVDSFVEECTVSLVFLSKVVADHKRLA